MTIILESIDLSLITKNHPIPIEDSPILMTLSQFQPATHIFGFKQWGLSRGSLPCIKWEHIMRKQGYFKGFNVLEKVNIVNPTIM